MISSAQWVGTVPKQCDMCNAVITDVFVDGRTDPAGSWAIMCPECFAKYGCGLGIGDGQMYVKEGEEWLKKE